MICDLFRKHAQQSVTDLSRPFCNKQQWMNDFFPHLLLVFEKLKKWRHFYEFDFWHSAFFQRKKIEMKLPYGRQSNRLHITSGFALPSVQMQIPNAKHFLKGEEIYFKSLVFITLFFFLSFNMFSFILLEYCAISSL